MIDHPDNSQDRARGHYEARLNELREAVSRRTARYRLLINLELSLALPLAIVFYVLYTHRLMDPFLGTALYATGSMVVLSIPATFLLRIASKLRTSRKVTAYYEARMQRINGEWKGNGDEGSDFSVAEHPYCTDLDLFGAGSLFEYLSSAKTGAGREWLATALLAPASLPEVNARQDAIGELRDRSDLREYFASAGASGAYNLNGKSLPQWSQDGAISFSAFSPRAAACLCVINVVVIALALLGQVSPEAPLAPLALVAVLTIALHGKVTEVLERTDSVVAYELELLMAYSKQLVKEQFQCSLLQESTRSFRLLTHRCQRRLLRLIRLMRWHRDPAFTYFSYVSFWVVLLAMAVEKQRIAFGRDLATMTAALGELEGLTSLAAYAFEHSEYPFPSFASEKTSTAVFVADLLGHPLIDSAVCVRNSVRIDDHNRLLVVSGSNMSGKSTYLRAIGINYVLARAGAPVCAASLRMSVFSIATSMRVLDSLTGGKSRFFAEVSLVKQVMDRAEQEPVLFLFDELFSGTNSEDRRAGTVGVITHLLKINASGFLTTHDLALSELVDSQPSTAKNLHFIDQITGEAMTFDYRLRDGPSPHTNGAFILRKLGIL